MVRQRAHGSLFNRTLKDLARVASVMRATRASKPDGYLLGSYRSATAPEPNASTSRHGIGRQNHIAKAGYPHTPG
jgi:hypothetical protein